MEENLPVRQPSLADQVYEIIVTGIADGTYPAGSLLPSENQLAERFDVSRPTIRAAFARLVERGYVRRQRGVGTFVAESPSIMNPLYQLLDVRERISARGFKPGFKQLKSEIVEADELAAEKLDVKPGSPVLHVQKLFTADGKPIIMFVNHIPTRTFKDCLTVEQALEPGITEPFFKFFSEICKIDVEYLTSIISPQLARECPLPDEFAIEDPNTPILLIDDVGYSASDVPVFHSIEYLLREASSFHVIRHVENY